MGAITSNFVWYGGDFELADVIVACAVKQLNIDTRRIYTGGCSAGGLQAGAMVYARSSYIAAAMPVSGGALFAAAPFDDPTHIPAVITSHGSRMGDNVVVVFADTSATLDNEVAAKGGTVVNCDWGGNHCMPPPEVLAAQWTFLKDHPFGFDPDPYAAALPESFPAFCKKIK
jgi:poly(3-hydroxybutyrate) depolymerase